MNDAREYHPPLFVDQHEGRKYLRTIRSARHPHNAIVVDVYNVLDAFNVTCPALQQLIKKALACGQRGHKDKVQDLKGMVAALCRAIELENMRSQPDADSVSAGDTEQRTNPSP